MKQVYRDYLLRIKPYVNFAAICRVLNLDQSNLSKFLKGDNSMMSEDNLIRIMEHIKQIVA